MLPEEVIDVHFDVAVRDAKIPPNQKETINQSQLSKLYAKAREWNWSKEELNALCKHSLGYQSKKDIHPGSAFDEILNAIEEKTLRNLVRSNMEDPMPRFLKGKCTGEAEKKQTSKYGMRVVADFETPDGEEVAIWTDPDTDLADALFGIREGDEVNIIQKDSGGNTLEDSEIEKFAPRGKKKRGQNGSQKTSSSGGGKKEKDAPTWGYVNRKQRLIGAAYVSLVQRFKEVAQDEEKEDFTEDDLPAKEEIAKMAISSTIQR